MAPAHRAPSRTAASLLVLALVGCEGAFTQPRTPAATGGSNTPCESLGAPVRLDRARSETVAGGTLVVRPTGGVGGYRFTLATNQSGAAVDRAFGVYVAGAPNDSYAEPVDVVLVEALGCAGQASTSVRVHESLTIAPGGVISVAPGQRVEFVGAGGTGRFAWSLRDTRSGATLDDAGVYVAGGVEGRDVVRLTDTTLSVGVEAEVDVRAGAGLSLAPQRFVVPLGSVVPLPVRGGSGTVRGTSSAPEVATTRDTDATVTGTAAGEAEITVTDAFTGERVTARVTVVAPGEATRRHPGDRSESHVFGGAADLDGDGFTDVIVGLPDWNADWLQSGVVLGFRGTPDGLSPTPAFALSGTTRSQEFGRSVTLADLTGDDRLDLVVGARRDDPTSTDVGTVSVYAGLGGTPWFTATPVREFFGRSGFDLFGNAVAVCDFDADGLRDLAVAAPFAELSSTTRDHGLISIFLAASPRYEFLSAPSAVLSGEMPGTDGAWAPVASMRYGEALAAADFDGDGACDLAVSALSPSTTRVEAGAVYLHRGRASRPGAPGGLDARPAIYWAELDDVDARGRFGHAISLGDTDGDGRADLLAGHYLHDAASGSDAGALHLFLGRSLDGTATAPTPLTDAAWLLEGGSGDRLGQSARLHTRPDGRIEIVSGAPRAGLPMGLSRPGVLRVHAADGAATPMMPAREIEGATANDWLGIGAGPIGDVDGDGTTDLLAFSPYRDGAEMNDDRGGLFAALSSGGLVELELPVRASGQRVAQGLAFVGDLDGDGSPELAVGAPNADIAGPGASALSLGRNVGVVRVYRGTATGTASAPAQTLSGFVGHGESDEFGWDVSAAGDFDGDGLPDLAVLARSEDIPTTLDPALYDVGPGCERRDNTGAVYVFRGRSDGTFDPGPAFVYFGPEANQRIERILGGLDVDGDGLDDLVAGAREWDAAGTNAGGIAIVRGRAASADRITAICTPDTLVPGVTGERLGAALARGGDLDADGCEELLAGAPEAAPTGAPRVAGAVRVFFGAGSACASSSLRSVTLVGTSADAQAGSALSDALDVTGDGVPDFVVGAPRFRDARGGVGSAMVVSGAFVRGALGAADALPLVEPGTTQRVWTGTGAGERLGTSVALVAGPDGTPVALLGGPFGNTAGRVDTGSVVVVPIGRDGFETRMAMQIAGESEGLGQLGETLAAVRAGTRTYVAVGAPFSSMVAREDGASYTFTLSSP
jgi:hypothetical protein